MKRAHTFALLALSSVSWQVRLFVANFVLPILIDR